MRDEEIITYITLTLFTFIGVLFGNLSRTDGLLAMVAITLIYILMVLCRIYNKLK